MATKRDANDVLRNEGVDALRAEHDKAKRWNDEKRQHRQGSETQRVHAPGQNGHNTDKPPQDGASADIEFIDDMALPETGNDVLEGIIPAKSSALIYGMTGVGKTFFAIEALFCIALGKPFFGRETQQGAVLYIALEGLLNFRKRAIAARNKHGSPGKLFALLKSPIVLGRDPASKASVALIIESAKYLAVQAGCSVRVIVIDTLFRALAGDDEKEAACISAVMSQIADIIAATGATVLLIHHPGKDAAKGPRGSSPIVPAVEAATVIERDGKAAIRTATLEKQRDGAEGPIGAFTLKTVEVGRDKNAKTITTCVVEPLPGGTTKNRSRPKPESQAGKALNELEHLLIAEKGEVSHGHERIPEGVRRILRPDWEAKCRQRRLADGNKKSETQAFRRALRTLSAANLVADYGDFVWLTEASKTA